MALQEPSVGLFGRITTDNTLPERDSEGADPQRELRNVRPNSLEKAMRSNQASPRARGPADGSQRHFFLRQACFAGRFGDGTPRSLGVRPILEPWGQTDLEFLVEIILNRSDPKKPVGLTPRSP